MAGEREFALHPHPHGVADLPEQQAQAPQQQIDALRNALAARAGAGPDRGLAIRRPALGTPAIALPSVLPSDLLARRPDVVAARWRVEAAARGIDASKAAFYPSINLAAMVGLAAGNLGDLFGRDALLINGGPALSLPIFDGGRLEQQLRASDADYDLAVAGYDQALLGAIREVADAVQAARALDAQIASTAQARQAAAQAHALVLQRRQAGLATQLDVLTAQKPLLQLDQQLAALRAKRRLAAIDLDQALGGGVPVAAPSPTASN
jgi:NodT family efflux transporter outer membrane factor (OMF) lipoprotein